MKQPVLDQYVTCLSYASLIRDSFPGVTKSTVKTGGIAVLFYRK